MAIYNGRFEKDGFNPNVSIENSDFIVVEDLHELIRRGISDADDGKELNVFAIVLCTNGKASAVINDEAYEIRKDDIIVCVPETIIEKGLVSFDFEYKCLCLSINFVREIQPSILINGWDIIKRLKEKPVFHLSDSDLTAFHLYYELLKNKLKNPSRDKYFRETLVHIIMAFLYEMQNSDDILLPQISTRQFSSAENIFSQFIELLRKTTPKRRNVAYYSKQLNITSKYLWQICRNVDGRSVSEIIDAFVVEEIKKQLKYTNKSIKQISADLDFPNMSFFGRYAKKNLGMSPKQYRGCL